MTLEQLNALIAKAKEQKKVVATTGDKHFKEAKSATIEIIDEFVREHSVDVPMLMRALCEHYEVKSLKKGKRKGKSTGISRANGNRTVNGYMVLLNEERRKYKLYGRKEPTAKTADFILTKVVAQKWQELKAQGITNADLQINYQDWSKENPTDPTTASPIFINWWKMFNNADYNTPTDFDATVDVEAWKGGEEVVENVVKKQEEPTPVVEKKKRKRRTKKEMEEAKKMEAEDVDAPEVLDIGLGADDSSEEVEEEEEESSSEKEETSGDEDEDDIYN